MSPVQLMLILRARAKLIFTVLAVTAIAALVASLLIPKTYLATVSLVLNYKGTDPVMGNAAPGQMTSGYLPTYMSTQVDIIKSINVALKVVDKLNLASSPAVKEDYQNATGGKGDIRYWIAEGLLKKIEVKPVRESSVININVKHRDPNMAAQIANAFADSYQEANVQLDANPLKGAAQYLDSQAKSLRDAYEAAQQKVSKFQQEHGLVSADSKVDVETARLTELSNQLVTAQAQALEAKERRGQVQGGKAEESPDVASNQLIQNLRFELDKAESKLSALGNKVTEFYPPYQEAKAEVDKLRARLQAQIALASKSISNNAKVLERRERELSAAVEAQKAKVLELNRWRGELAVLNREMEYAQRNYEAASQRLAQTRIQGQSNQSDVAVLNAATAPLIPANPSKRVTLLLAIFVGAFLGICAALLSELRDRRVRSARDLELVLGLPVLANLDRFGGQPAYAGGSGLVPWSPVRALLRM